MKKSPIVKALTKELGLPVTDLKLPSAIELDEILGMPREVHAMEAGVYDQLPEWAIGHANGEYMLGAQLPTRDGRRMGNAHIVNTSIYIDSVELSHVQYHILTDAGTQLTMTAGELEECFYPPKYVSDVKEVLAKFSRTPWLFTSHD